MYSLLYNKKVGDSSDEGIGVVSTPTTLLPNPKISQEESVTAYDSSWLPKSFC